MYVDMIVTNSVEPGATPRVSLDRLKREIPVFEWSKGHSGSLLPEVVATILEELCEGNDEVELAN